MRSERSERSDYDITTEDERSEPSRKIPKTYVTQKTFFVESPKIETKKPTVSTVTSENGKVSEKTITATNVFAELDEIVDLCKTANNTDQSKPVKLSRETSQNTGNQSHAVSHTPLTKPTLNGGLSKPDQNGGSTKPNQNGGSTFKINIERKKRIEIEKLETGMQQDFDFDFANIRRGKDNTYTEYFDNLIALIDEATRELSI